MLWLSCANVLENRVFALFFYVKHNLVCFYIHRRQQEGHSWSCFQSTVVHCLVSSGFKGRNNNSFWTHNRHCCLLLHRRLCLFPLRGRKLRLITDARLFQSHKDLNPDPDSHPSRRVPVQRLTAPSSSAAPSWSLVDPGSGFRLVSRRHRCSASSWWSQQAESCNVSPGGSDLLARRQRKVRLSQLGPM